MKPSSTSRRSLRSLGPSGLLLLAAGTGCVRKPLPDWPAVSVLEELEAEVAAHPQEASPLLRLAAVVEGWQRAGAGPVWGIDLEARAEAVLPLLVAHAEAHPDHAGRVLAAAGRLQRVLGRPADAEAQLRASLDTHRTLEAMGPLLALLDEGGRSEEIAPLCADTRAWLSAEENVVALFDACAAYDPRIRWASEADQARWMKLQEDRQYRSSLAHEVRWADVDRLGEAYGLQLRQEVPVTPAAVPEGMAPTGGSDGDLPSTETGRSVGAESGAADDASGADSAPVD